MLQLEEHEMRQMAGDFDVYGSVIQSTGAGMMAAGGLLLAPRDGPAPAPLAARS